MLMRWVWIAAAGFVLLALEVGVAAHLKGFGGGPDLALLFVVFLALYGPLEDAPISGWVIGISKDMLSGGQVGLYAVLFMGLSFFLSRIRADIFLEYNKSHIVNCGIATLAVYLGAGAWYWVEGASIVGTAPLVLGVSVWNAALAPAAFWAFFKLSRALGTSRRPV